MKALITTGGMAVRMQLEKGMNKCLLSIGGKSILEHSVHALKTAGVEEIVIATGYCADRVREEIKDQATYVHNSAYETAGLVVTISKARDLLEGKEFVLIMGDSLYHPDMLDRAMNAPGDIVVTYEVKDTYVPEDSKAIVNDGCVQYMGKDIPPQETSGEFGHMIKFSAEGSQIFFEEVGAFIEAGKGNVYLMDVINQIISKNVQVQALDITGIARTEIDFQEDLEAAREAYASGTYQIIKK